MLFSFFLLAPFAESAIKIMFYAKTPFGAHTLTSIMLNKKIVMQNKSRKNLALGANDIFTILGGFVIE